MAGVNKVQGNGVATAEGTEEQRVEAETRALASLIRRVAAIVLQDERDREAVGQSPGAEQEGRLMGQAIGHACVAAHESARKRDLERANVAVRDLADWLNDRPIEDKLLAVVMHDLAEGDVDQLIQKAGYQGGQLAQDLIEDWRREIESAGDTLTDEQQYAMSFTRLLTQAVGV